MCGIAGFVNPNGCKKERQKYLAILEDMNRRQKHRGPDDDGIYLDDLCGLAHVRLSILDVDGGGQPIHWHYSLKNYTIIYNGEIYNMPALRRELEKEGIPFETTCDTEVILKGYCRYGTAYFSRLNGIFAIALWEHEAGRLLLVRDRLGVKPLFYTKRSDTLIFASEIKSILAYPYVRPIVSREGLCELLALGPAHSPEKCVYKDIYQVLPGHYLSYQDGRLDDHTYWELRGSVHTDSEAETVEKTAFLVEDAIRMQMLSDIPVCTFLSGGLDSSIVSAVCAGQLKKKGTQLSTYSFDFTGNDVHYIENSFQPTQDAPFAKEMARYLNSDHTCLFCDNTTLADHLYTAVNARDFPCMADVESSLIYFCGQVARRHRVTLTGECADEIFGGYPWFYRQEMFDRDDFPWSYDMTTRRCLLNDKTAALPLAEYAHDAYRRTILETPVCLADNPKETRGRQLQYLNLRWFMATLLERMDRTSMHSGLEARVPFADHRIVEYLYNVPWELKSLGGQEKGLLRRAMSPFLPEMIAGRKKSPYPKTYHPEYEAILKKRFAAMVSDPREPIHELLSKNAADTLLAGKLEYTKPWYGQLMAGPQLLAYFLQINYWLKTYEPVLEF